jgi:hypothetical protein
MTEKYNGKNRAWVIVPYFPKVLKMNQSIQVERLPDESVKSKNLIPHTNDLWLPVSEEYPISVRALDEGECELALWLKKMPRLPPELREAGSSGSEALVRVVAEAVALSLTSSKLEIATRNTLRTKL